MADNRNTLTDEILVLAETLGDIKARFERVESEFETQSKPLEAALAALSAAMTGIKTLQHHVLDNSLSALSLKVEEQRKAIDDQITVIVGELKGADAQNSEKIALQTAELKQQFSEISANVNQLAAQFEGQLKRVELEAQEKLTKFAAVPGPQGPAGASINPRGNWIDGVTYNRLDVVSLLGTSYISAVDNNTSKPARNGDKWTVLARAGTGGGGAGNFASLAGIAEVVQGGTGITQYAVGDILYASATGALSRLGAGVNGQFLKTTGPGSAPEWETPAGGGDVVGPASATDNALVRFDGTSGTAVQNSNATLTDAGALTLASNLTVNGTGTQTLNGKLDVITASSSAANVDLAVLRQNYAGTAGHEGLISFTNISGTSVGKIGTRAVDGNNTSLVLRNFVSGSLADALTLSSSVATLSGNLTVSGTGNNVFRGPIRWGNTSWPGYNGYISEASTDTALNPAIARNLIGSTGSNYTIADGQLGYYSGFELGTDIRWFLASGTFTTGQSLVPTERMRLTYQGNLLINTPTDVGAKVYSKVADGVLSFGAAGTTKGIRFAHASTYSSIDGVDSSLSGSYQPLQINGSTVQIATNGGTVAASFDTSQNATFAGKVTLNGAYTSTTSAALNISGVSIPGITLQTTSGSGRNFFIGSNYSSAGILTFSGSSSAGGAATTQLVNLDATNEVVKIPLSTASTTTGSGALQVSGGAGVTGAVNVGTYYGMVDGVTAPAATSGYAKIYVDTADGDLKVIFGDGTVKTIVTD